MDRIKQGIKYIRVGVILVSLIFVVLNELSSKLHILDFKYTSWFPYSSEVPDRSNLASTVLQISATLLGLYFATIGIVTSTVHSKSPDTIRKKFLIDAFKTRFIKINLITIFSSLFISLTQNSEHKLHYSVYFWLVCLLTLTLLDLFDASIDSFQFLNPGVLLKDYKKSFNKYQDNCINNIEDQNSSKLEELRIKAEDELNNIRYISTETIALRPHDAELLAKTGDELVELLATYSTKKLHIPFNSDWYITNQEYPNYLRLSYQQTWVFDTTLVPVTPVITKNTHWVEEKVEQELLIIFSKLLKTSLFESHKLSESLKELINRRFQNFQSQDALNLWLAMIEQIINNSKSIFSKESFDKERYAFLQQLLELMGEMYIGPNNSFIIKYERVENISIDDLTAEKNIELYGLSPKGIEEVKKIKQGLLDEAFVSGSINSPQTYITKLLIQITFKDSLKEIVYTFKQLNSSTIQLYHSAMSIDDERSAATIILKSIQILNSLRGAYLNNKQFIDIMMQDTDPDELTGIEKKLNNLEYSWVYNYLHFLKLLNKCSIKLASLNFDSSQPDVFGHVLAMKRSLIEEAILKDDIKTLNLLFPSYLESIFDAYKRILDTSSPEEDWIIHKFANGVFIDTFELSGMALISSAFGKTNSWIVLEKFWLSYLAKYTNEFVTALIEMMDADDSFPLIQPKGVTRTDRFITFIKTLNDKYSGVNKEDLPEISQFYINNTEYSFYGREHLPAEIFVYTWLFDQTSKIDDDLNPRFESLRKKYLEILDSNKEDEVG